MALDRRISDGKIGRPKGLGAWGWLALPLISASCTPMLAEGPSAPLAAPSVDIELNLLPVEAQIPAPVRPAMAPSIAGPESLASPGQGLAAVFEGRTALDRLRSHDCLAQAIYYEAASESDEGQRAVAQVVLNRVRHPSWPNSVCGVVYQGPLRAGGGCQFSFTCDGSLARPARGPAWAKARRFAAEALAGRSATSVGLATHYHTHAVSPDWAPRLARVGAIGAHAFYRLPGRWGEASAFAAPYSGTEPMPRPSVLLQRSPAAATGASAAPAPDFGSAHSAAWASQPPLTPRAEAVAAPVSTVREEYRHSGQWRKDAPAAVTGRSAS